MKHRSDERSKNSAHQPKHFAGNKLSTAQQQAIPTRAEIIARAEARIEQLKRRT